MSIMPTPRYWLLAVLALSGAVCAPPASADVYPREGRFVLVQRDTDSSREGFSFERVYRSQAGRSGMFGEGWCSLYESRLRASVDGSVVVEDCDGQQQTRFMQTVEDENVWQARLLGQIGKITIPRALQVAGTPESPSFRVRLRFDAEFRDAVWNDEADAGRLPRLRPQMKPGEVFQAVRGSGQYLVAVVDGFERHFSDGRVEHFDAEGRLDRKSWPDKSVVSLEYNPAGELVAIHAGSAHLLQFERNGNHRVSRLVIDSRPAMEYHYDASGLLVETRNPEGSVRKYSYDGTRNRNMTAVEEADGTKRKITYLDSSMEFRVGEETDPDGTRTEYVYDLGKTPARPLEFSVTITKHEDANIERYRREYSETYDVHGVKWLQSEKVLRGGEDAVETEYSVISGAPTLIRQGATATRYAYNDHGLVSRKETDEEISEFEYDLKWTKVTSVKRTVKSSPEAKLSYRYKYDESGNLVQVEDASGQVVKLTYDSAGLIDTMHSEFENHTQVLRFKYNARGKPVEITDPEIGTIEVTYQPNGEILSVNSSAGTQVALIVTQAFEKLLELIRPARMQDF
jgi:YD repeat-containing protein